MKKKKNNPLIKILLHVFVITTIFLIVPLSIILGIFLSKYFLLGFWCLPLSLLSFIILEKYYDI